MHAKLNGSSSPSDEVNIQGDDSQSYRGVKNKTHAGVDRTQTDHAQVTDKMTLAYNVGVLQLRRVARGWFLDPDVVNAIVILQKLQDHCFIPVNLTISAGTSDSTLLAQIFRRELDFGVFGILAFITGQSFVHLVVAVPKPHDGAVVRVHLLSEIRRHCREVLFALLAAKEVLDVFSYAHKNLQSCEMFAASAVDGQGVKQSPQTTRVAAIMRLTTSTTHPFCFFR